jgi:hypothetical protein
MAPKRYPVPLILLLLPSLLLATTEEQLFSLSSVASLLSDDDDDDDDDDDSEARITFFLHDDQADASRDRGCRERDINGNPSIVDVAQKLAARRSRISAGITK